MKFIEIKLTKCKVYLTEKEILSILNNNPCIFKEGLQRGKAIKRSYRRTK
jgi:hypothetical protein